MLRSTINIVQMCQATYKAKAETFAEDNVIGPAVERSELNRDEDLPRTVYAKKLTRLCKKSGALNFAQVAEKLTATAIIKSDKENLEEPLQEIINNFYGRKEHRK